MAAVEQPPLLPIPIIRSGSIRINTVRLSVSEQDARIFCQNTLRNSTLVSAQCSLFTLSAETDNGIVMSLFSDVVQHPVSDVLGGSHTLSLYCYVYDEDENGRQIPVSASLVVTRRSSTDEVEFTGHITIGGGGSFALSATSGGKGPSDSIEFTVGDEIFFDARDEEEEEEDNFQECQESLGRNDWMDHCRDVVVTNLQGSDVEPSVIEQWCDKAKSCRDDEMGEEKVLSSAYDLLVRTSSSEVALETILGLVALHPAPHVVIFWLRVSPPFVPSFLVSQVCAPVCTTPGLTFG